MFTMVVTSVESPFYKAESAADMIPRSYLGRIYLVYEHFFDPKFPILNGSSDIQVRGRIGDRGMIVTDTGVRFGDGTSV